MWPNTTWKSQDKAKDKWKTERICFQKLLVWFLYVWNMQSSFKYGNVSEGTKNTCSSNTYILDYRPLRDRHGRLCLEGNYLISFLRLHRPSLLESFGGIETAKKEQKNPACHRENSRRENNLMLSSGERGIFPIPDDSVDGLERTISFFGSAGWFSVSAQQEACQENC